MLIALFISCLSDPNSTQPLPATGDQTLKSNSSVFMQECIKHQHPTIAAVLDRIEIDDCNAAFKHLSEAKVLDLSNYPNSFTDISILGEFTQIEELYLNDSQVSDLSPLSQFHNLQKLHAEHCAVEDIRPLSNLSNLEDLLLDYTGVDDLEPIKNLISLKRIGLRNTRVRSLTPLASLKSLISIELSGTAVTDLSTLSSIDSLQVLSLRQTSISSITPLAKQSKLFFLDLKDTNVGDINPLKDLTNLKVLDISETKVTDLSALHNMAPLLELNVQGLQVSIDDCNKFSGTVQGCSVLNDDKLYRLCTNSDDFVFATQVSMSSLKNTLNERDCTKITTNSETLTTFSSTEPFPDPRVFSFFPNLKTIDIPIEQVLYEYCSNDDIGVIKDICHKKRLAMKEVASKNKEHFVQECQTDTGAAGFTFSILKRKFNVTNCNDLWANLSMVEKLSLQRVELTNVSPFRTLGNLRDLSIDYNDIHDLSPLSQLPHLQVLWVDDNHLADISPLKDLSLLWLSAGDNKIEDISALVNSTNLQRLWLGGNQIRDITALKGLHALDKLHLAINDIEDISPLGNLTSLSSLYLSYNKIQNIGPLHDLDELHVLSNGLDHEESPLEMQRWFLHGNPIDKRTCTAEKSPPAVTLFCSQYN